MTKPHNTISPIQYESPGHAGLLEPHHVGIECRAAGIAADCKIDPRARRRIRQKRFDHVATLRADTDELDILRFEPLLQFNERRKARPAGITVCVPENENPSAIRSGAVEFTSHPVRHMHWRSL